MSRLPDPSDLAVLGLRPGAGEVEIRDAYRRLAKIHHPDRNPGDPAAAEMFARITESYAALRNRTRGVGRAAPSPLSHETRPMPARARAAPVRLGDLDVGGSAWVDAAALLVGPDRTATLRPDAVGSLYPGVDHVIRVEQRADGIHVFMPPQPTARWPISRAAEAAGLAIVSLHVGDRQDGETGPESAAQLPLRLVRSSVGDMEDGERGWVAPAAITVDELGVWYIDLRQARGPEPHVDTPVRVFRDGDGWRAHSELAPARWTPGSTPDPATHRPLAALILAGDAFPPTDV